MFQSHFCPRILSKKCLLWPNALPQPTQHHCKTSICKPRTLPLLYMLQLYWYIILRPNRKHRGLLALGIGRKPPRASFLSPHLRLSFPLIPTCNYRKYKSSQAISKEVPGRMRPATCSPHITAKLLEDKEITWFPQHLTFFKALLSALYSSRGWRLRGEQNRKHSIPVEK